jgi:hypothetical protein
MLRILHPDVKKCAIPSFELRSFSEGVPCTVTTFRLKYHVPIVIWTARIMRRLTRHPCPVPPAELGCSSCCDATGWLLPKIVQRAIF